VGVFWAVSGKLCVGVGDVPNGSEDNTTTISEDEQFTTKYAGLGMACCNVHHMPLQTNTLHIRTTTVQRRACYAIVASIHVPLCVLRCMGSGMRGVLLGSFHQNECIIVRSRAVTATASKEWIAGWNYPPFIDLCHCANYSRVAISIDVSHQLH
jgi:hypothetical protein